MKKILTFFMTMMMLLVTVNAGSFVFDQPTVLKDFTLADKGNVQLVDLIGSLNSESIGNQSGDLKLQFPSLQNKQYFVIDNGLINTTFNVTTFFEGEGNSVTQELTMQELGTYYFQGKNDFQGEELGIMFDFPDGYAGTMTLISQQPKGLSFVFETFVSGVADIIEINVSFWKVVYYIFLVSTIIGMFLLIIKGIMAAIKWADDLSKTRNKHGKGKQ